MRRGAYQPHRTPVQRVSHAVGIFIGAVLLALVVAIVVGLLAWAAVAIWTGVLR